MEDIKLVKHHKMLMFKFVGTNKEFEGYLAFMKKCALDTGCQYTSFMMNQLRTMEVDKNVRR